MKRSGWLTGAVVAHFLCGGLFFGICILLLVLKRHPEVKYGKDAADVVHGLNIAFGLLAPVAGAVLAGAWGLAKRKLWGWWLALLTDVGLFGILLYSMIDDGLNNIDWDVFGCTAVAFVLTAWLWMPAVRRFYWHNMPNAPSKLNEVIADR